MNINLSSSQEVNSEKLLTKENETRERRIHFLGKIAELTIPLHSMSEPFWVAASRNLWIALQLYLLDSSEPSKKVEDMVRLKKANLSAWIQEVLITQEAALDPYCVEHFNRFLQCDLRLQQTIVEVFLSHFKPIDNKINEEQTV